MFDRIKKAFTKDAPAAEAPEGDASHLEIGPMSEWAATHGFAFSADGSGHGIALEGKVGGKPWRLQRGRPSRSYIMGAEVRARAELGINEDVAVLVMNRPLKESLEKKAYQMVTDDLQTAVDSSLPEEMRWLTMFPEVGWDALPNEFWSRFSVMSDSRDNAIAWVDSTLVRLMLDWPAPAPSAEVPFMILLMRGKCYLRMEYSPADLTTLQQAAMIFTNSCECALGAFSSPVTRPA